MRSPAGIKQGKSKFISDVETMVFLVSSSLISVAETTSAKEELVTDTRNDLDTLGNVSLTNITLEIVSE